MVQYNSDCGYSDLMVVNVTVVVMRQWSNDGVISKVYALWYVQGW